MIRALARKIIGTGGVAIIQRILQLLIAIVLAKLLKEDGYGLYSYALSITALIALPTQAGLPNLIIREIAANEVKENWGTMRGLVQWSTRLVISLSVLIGLPIAFFLPRLLSANTSFDDSTFLWALLSLPLSSLAAVRTGILRGLRQPVIGAIPEGVILPALNLLVLSYVLVTQLTMPPWVAMSFRTAATGVAFIAGIILVAKAMPKDCWRSKAKYQRSAWISSLIPFTLMSGMTVIHNQTDIVMIGSIHEPSDVGIYKAVSQIVSLVVLTTLISNTVIAPNLARSYAKQDIRKIQEILTFSARIMFVMALPFAIVYLLFGASILGFLFGDGYAAGATALSILTIGKFVSVAFGSVAHILNMTGNERETLKGLALSAIANVILNFVLIPKYNIEGAAAATLISMIIWNSFLWFQVNRKLGLETTILGQALLRRSS